jgi:galactokinase
MAEVFRFGKMDPGMMVSGKMEWHMDWVDWFMLKVTYTKVNGLKIKLMVMESNKTIKEADTKEIGRMINRMVKESKNGLTVQFMKESIKMV